MPCPKCRYVVSFTDYRCPACGTTVPNRTDPNQIKPHSYEVAFVQNNKKILSTTVPNEAELGIAVRDLLSRGVLPNQITIEIR